MNPKAPRQDTRHRMRKHTGPQRPKTRTTMTTEYQESFRPPSCYTLIQSTRRDKGPYHPLKGTTADTGTLGIYYVTQKWKKPRPKAPQQPSVAPKDHRRLRDSLLSRGSCLADQPQPKIDFTTTYSNDFRPGKLNTHPSCKPKDWLKVNQGVVVPEYTSAADSVPQEQQPKPIESITSYLSDYLHVQSKKPSTPPDYVPHVTDTCQDTKPTLSSTQTSEKREEPLQGTATTKDECRVQSAPRRSTPVRKDQLDRPVKTPISACKPKPQSCKTSPKPSSVRPTANDTAVCCNATEKPQSRGVNCACVEPSGC